MSQATFPLLPTSVFMSFFLSFFFCSSDIGRKTVAQLMLLTYEGGVYRDSFSQVKFFSLLLSFPSIFFPLDYTGTMLYYFINVRFCYHAT